MYASVIRRERFGEPKQAFATEVVDTPAVGRGQVLVWVMAAGINYNNVWASLGYPVDVISMRQKLGQPEDYHVGGSEGSGIVWAVGDGVTSVAVGDHVVLAGAQWDELAEDVRAGTDHPVSKSMRAWGYETNHGSFAQFCLVSDFQCHPKPKRLTWAEAACFMVTGPTAYRQLFGWSGNVVRPGDVVLIWGGAGGLGSMAIQLTRMVGGDSRSPLRHPRSGRKFCLELGAADDIGGAEIETELGPLLGRGDGHRDRADHSGQLDRHGAESPGAAPDQHDVPWTDDVARPPEQLPVRGRPADHEARGLRPVSRFGFG